MFNIFVRCVVFSFLVNISFRGSAQIRLIPTIHGLHKTNEQYNYDSLKLILKSFQPDIILVEIRDEDKDADSAYLAANYPFEMRMMRTWFPNTELRGFDWLGDDIEGKTIPANYWKTISPIKQWEKALQADTVYAKKLEDCEQYSEQRMKILKNSSLSGILNSNDRRLTLQYYECLHERLKGSVHERILEFYDMRNRKMLENIHKIVVANKNKRIIVLTGDDHFAYLYGKIEN